MGNANADLYCQGFKMAKPVKKSDRRKSSIETLLESMNHLANSAVRKMTAAEIRQARKEINDSIDRVLASGRKRRRES